MRRFAAARTATALVAALAAGGGSIWTFQVENDAVSTLSGTSDQYYTSGLRLGWTSGADAVDFGSSIGHAVWGEFAGLPALFHAAKLFHVEQL